MKTLLSALLMVVLGSAPHAFARQDATQNAPKVRTYDESADGRADVDAALARAKKDNKRVLIQWGANWCGWCNTLHGVMNKDRELSRKLMYEYEVVRVDIGKFDKHMELAKSYGVELKSVPHLTILDAAGAVLAQHDTVGFEIAETKSHDPVKITTFLTEHQAPYLDAAKVQAAAFERAKAENKRVFLHFGAPWCGWCHKLEAWMAQPEVSAVLAKEFVDLKIDTDRMKGGAELLTAARAVSKSTGEGIPWFVLIDANGTQLATSDAATGNVGFPYKDEEIAHFVAMLDKAKQHLSSADIEALRKSLVAVREADERKKAAR